MLVIRLQRTGRKGHAMFRIVVQDSRRTPSSGKVVARLGSYDPHQKVILLDKEKTSTYLSHGAQPSARMITILEKEGVSLPDWVKKSNSSKEGKIKFPEKRRSTNPKEEPVEEVIAEVAEELAVEAEEEASQEVASEESTKA